MFAATPGSEPCCAVARQRGAVRVPAPCAAHTASCLEHCYCSPAVAGLAYVALAYLGASVLYLAIVAAMGFGTPFKDTLTEEQALLLRRSQRDRGASFAVGVGVMAVVMLVLRPLK